VARMTPKTQQFGREKFSHNLWDDYGNKNRWINVIILVILYGCLNPY